MSHSVFIYLALISAALFMISGLPSEFALEGESLDFWSDPTDGDAGCEEGFRWWLEPVRSREQDLGRKLDDPILYAVQARKATEDLETWALLREPIRRLLDPRRCALLCCEETRISSRTAELIGQPQGLPNSVHQGFTFWLPTDQVASVCSYAFQCPPETRLVLAPRERYLQPGNPRMSAECQPLPWHSRTLVVFSVRVKVRSCLRFVVRSTVKSLLFYITGEAVKRLAKGSQVSLTDITAGQRAPTQICTNAIECNFSNQIASSRDYEVCFQNDDFPQFDFTSHLFTRN